MALHYVEDIRAVCAQVFQTLVPGGRFVFSVEHPVITSCDRAWQSGGPRQHWIVDGYFETGPRVTSWMGGRVVKYHRTIEDYFGALAGAGFRVVGIDYAEGMLAVARAKVTASVASNLSFQPMDLNERLEFPDARFDHVINISVLQVAADPARTLGELWRVLRPGGTLVLLHVPRPDSLDLPMHKAIGHRLQSLEKRTPWRVALIAAKAWAERMGSTRFWTADELRVMLASSQFGIETVSHGPPIVMVVSKLEA